MSEADLEEICYGLSSVWVNPDNFVPLIEKERTCILKCVESGETISSFIARSVRTELRVKPTRSSNVVTSCSLNNYWQNARGISCIKFKIANLLMQTGSHRIILLSNSLNKIGHYWYIWHCFWFRNVSLSFILCKLYVPPKRRRLSISRRAPLRVESSLEALQASFHTFVLLPVVQTNPVNNTRHWQSLTVHSQRTLLHSETITRYQFTKSSLFR